jgi:hypothetical protein
MALRGSAERADALGAEIGAARDLAAAAAADAIAADSEAWAHTRPLFSST